MNRNNVKKTKKMTNLILALALGTTGALSIASPVFAAKPANTGATTATTTSRPDPAQKVLDYVAEELGRNLTTSETTEIKAALADAKAKSDEANATFAEDVADALGLTLDQVKAALQKHAPLAQTLSELLGHKLTAAEITVLQDALKARNNLLHKIHDELVETLASITGLTTDAAAEALAPPKPQDKPAEKPACKPGTGTQSGNAQTSGSQTSGSMTQSGQSGNYQQTAQQTTQTSTGQTQTGPQSGQASGSQNRPQGGTSGAQGGQCNKLSGQSCSQQSSQTSGQTSYQKA